MVISMKSETTMTQTKTNFNLTYPDEVNHGGGAAVRWIKGLSREELHHVVQDKQLSIPLLTELVRNVPIKYLKNLVHHKKCSPDLRITILRRIYRAQKNEMQISDRLQTYSAILKIQGLSEKEKRIIRSYVSELNKSKESNELASSKKKIKKTSKQPKKATSRDLPRLVIRDSTVSEVVSFLKKARYALVSESGLDSNGLTLCRTKSAAMLAYSQRTFKSLASFSIHKVDIEDLLAFRMGLNNGLYAQSQMASYEDFLKNYESSNRGEVAKNFLQDVNPEDSAPEILYTLLVKVSSLSSTDFTSKKHDLLLASKCFDVYLAGISPELNYGQVETTSGGMAKISFSASLNLKFTEDSFKYWESSQDETFAFPIKFQVDYDRSTNLNNCKVTITNLLPGVRYKYEIKALNGDSLFKLASREFKIPDLPVQLAPSRYVRDYREYGEPLPFGGGGERRFSQF